MPKIASLRNHSKVFKTPRRPFEKERLLHELKVCGEFGLKSKREIWRVQFALAKIRTVARNLLTLEEKDPKRIFEGAALLRRLHKLGVLGADKNQLDYVLSLKVEDFLDRRLQTIVLKRSLAKSIHDARVRIRQRHIRVENQLVNIPSYLVRLDSEKHIDFSSKSPYAGGRPGRVKRRKMKAAAGGDGEEEEEILSATSIKGEEAGIETQKGTP